MNRELGGIVVYADAHPTLVARNVIDAVRNGFPIGVTWEVVDTDPGSLSLAVPLTPLVVEFAD